MREQNRKPLELRPYQREALESIQNYDGQSGLAVMATGLGKTVVFTDFLRAEVEQSDHHCLILSHRAELVTQPLSYLADIPCGIELAEQHADTLNVNIVSASVQSIVRRLGRFNPREFDTIIVDEAHHAAAPTYRKILGYFENSKTIGFTATAHRGDGVALGHVFNDIIFERDTLWGIENGYLTQVKCIQTRLKYNMGSVKINEFGEFSAKDVAKVMSGTAAGVVEAYENYAVGQTLIFAASVDEAKDITELINRKAGKQVAVSIFGNTRNRDSHLRAFSDGLIRVIVNFGVLTEGVDLPCTETVIIARPIAKTNVGLYAQMVGRGLRLYPGKEFCHIIDCIGISDVPLCTAATLIGKDLPDEKDPEKKDPPLDNAPLSDNTITLEEIPDTWIKSKREVNVMEKGKGADRHSVAWRDGVNGQLILAIPGVIYRISSPLSDGTVYLHKNKKSSKNPMPLQFVLDYVYTDLKARHSKNEKLWNTEKRKLWDKEKPTEQQLKLIKRLSVGHNINTDKLTRGDASSLIQELIYFKAQSEEQ